MMRNGFRRFFLGIILLFSTILVVHGDVCLMIYSMADNDLEYFLRRDLVELTTSVGIRDPTLTTWVYFDARNLGVNVQEDINDEIPELYNRDGTPLTGDKYEGSRYFTFDKEQNLMVVDTVLEGEQNSDDNAVLYQYLTRALTDCVARGSDEYFLLFTSHGAGYAGFGGDEHQRRRLSIQGNQFIIAAIQQTLADVVGTPNKVDVVAFDACLMMGLGAVDEFRDVADLYLAAEDTTPGHGWAYYALSETSTAFDIAVNLANTFLSETQAESPGEDYHQTPKTIALVNTTLFTDFLVTWENLMIEMKSLLDAQSDPDYFSSLSRARGNAMSISGYFDSAGTSTPSLVDIGSFFTIFQNICNVDPNSALGQLFVDAQSAYDNMFITRGNGPGTPEYTGMHVMWPFKREYAANRDFLDVVLFNTSLIFATADAPNWLTFLRTYYDSTTPSATGNSVCLQSSTIEGTSDGQLLVNPALNFEGDFDDLAVVTSGITVETDYVEVQYGVDVTHLVSRRFQRKLALRRATEKSCAATCRSIKRRRTKGRRHQRRRKMQDEDYYYLYGGDVYVNYAGSSVQSAWDRTFYYATDGSGVYENIFVYDEGAGLKNFDICYFPLWNPVTASNFAGVLDVAQAVETLGCIFGEVVFSTSQNSRLSLYTYDESSGTRFEVPSFFGGQIVPIVYVDYNVQGENITEIVGGFEETIYEWGPSGNLSVVAVTDDFNLDIFGSEVVFLEIYAYDWDTFFTTPGGLDYDIFPYSIVNDTAAPSAPLNTDQTKSPDTKTPDDADQTESRTGSPGTVAPTPSEKTDQTESPTRSPSGGGGGSGDSSSAALRDLLRVSLGTLAFCLLS